MTKFNLTLFQTSILNLNFAYVHSKRRNNMQTQQNTCTLYKENANLEIGVKMTNVYANLTEHVQTLYKLSMQY